MINYCASMGARLIVVAGPLRNSEVVLTESESLIGREPTAAISLNSRSVSRRHCLVRREGDSYVLQDLGSHNGTLVNDQRVSGHILQHGDRIAVADSIIVFAADGAELPFRAEVTESSDADAVQFATVQLAEPLFHNPERLLEHAETAKLGAEIGVILEINRKAATLRDPDQLQEALLQAAFQLTPAESAAILLYDQPDVNAAASSMLGRHRSAEALTAVQVSRTVTRRVLEEKVAVLARDIGSEEAFRNVHSLLAFGSRSVLCVPVLSRGRCLGVLYLDTRSAGAGFNDRHLETMTGVAAVVGLSLENALDFQRMRAQAELLQAALLQDRAMIGDSAAMKKIYETIAKVAASETTVLVLGESGTGKEVAARAIHRNSKRTDKAFVAVNCATLGDTLLESELFGHEKGAFTGAAAMKKGLLEVADGGTVFLDEVAELPLTVQAKLLRVLQEREFTRLGSTRPIHVNIRLIAATNKDLKAAVAAGRFREDLWHRLNVINIKLPPLRNRMEDLPLLANFFVAQASKRCGRRVLGISAEARAAMQRYDWPGNVRELENAIERAVVLGSDEKIQVSDLPETIWEGAGEEHSASGTVSYHAALTEAKRKIVTQALEQSGGNYTEAARRLGVHVTYIHRLMRAFKSQACADAE
jgi:transcriptional regulator with GAF, ATPase, and Fis domain